MRVLPRKKRKIKGRQRKKARKLRPPFLRKGRREQAN